jgi:hypothetical protein
MGASTFITTAKGTTAQEAFDAAREEARYEHGHGGYTGTIAEKRTYVMTRDDGGVLKARLTRAVDAVREIIAEIAKGKPIYDLGVGTIARRAGMRVELHEPTLKHMLKPEAMKALRDEARRLREMRSRCKARMSAEAIASLLLEIEDERFDDKFGPAGCIDLTPRKQRDKEFLFFGWASS